MYCDVTIKHISSSTTRPPFINNKQRVKQYSKSLYLSFLHGLKSWSLVFTRRRTFVGAIIIHVMNSESVGGTIQKKLRMNKGKAGKFVPKRPFDLASVLIHFIQTLADLEADEE